MTECIGIEIDVYMLEFTKLHNHKMVFEKMNMMTVCSSPKFAHIWLNINGKHQTGENMFLKTNDLGHNCMYISPTWIQRVRIILMDAQAIVLMTGCSNHTCMYI